MLLRSVLLFSMLFACFVYHSLTKSLAPTTINLSTAADTIKKLEALYGDLDFSTKDISDVFIARKIITYNAATSVTEPIELKGFKIEMDLTPVKDLLAHYKKVRASYQIKDEEYKEIPSLLVRNKRKETNTILANQFSDFKKLEHDLFSKESLSKRIVLAENDTYTASNKPFSKYISKGIPGLKKKKNNSVDSVVKAPAPKLLIPDTMEQKINIKQSSSLRPLIEQYEKKNQQAKAKVQLKSKKKATAFVPKTQKKPVTSQMTSQKLLEAIKEVNGQSPYKMDSQRKRYEIQNNLNPLVIDMSKVASKKVGPEQSLNLMARAAAVADKNELFGELALKNDDRCIQPYVLNNLKRKTYNSSLRIAADSFMLDKGYQTDVDDFYIEFSDTYNDIRYSNRGLVEFENISLSNRFSVRRGTLYKSFHYPTVTDFVFENDDLTMNVPLIEINSMAKIIAELPQVQFDAHALIELDDSTEEVNLVGENDKFIYKFYLNENLRVVKPGSSDYSYILLTNIAPGNYFLEYKKGTGEKISKIVHIESQKVYYDTNFYVNETKDQFALYENDLLTRCAYEVDLDSERLVSISDEQKSKKVNTNNYQFKKTSYPLGTRKYYEIKYKNMSLFAGRQDTRKVVIPSTDYVDYLYDQFNINSLNGMCIIQLNLNKRADGIKVNMTSPNYSYDYDLLVLDQDGLFYKDFTANTNRVFILGTEQGVANIKLNYIDGSVDFIQSYCSDNTYLVEEL